MEELQTILLAHARRYPAMDCTDAVKLLYQNEFGGGHLISDEAACLRFLQEEYEAQTFQEPLLAEDIGNGYVRIHLRALDAHGYSASDLGRDFLRSARSQTGSLSSFLKKLEVLEAMTQQGLLPFTPEALREFLTEYAQKGYPMVSHSPRYRAHYQPAYRVLRREYLPF